MVSSSLRRWQGRNGLDRAEWVATHGASGSSVPRLAGRDSRRRGISLLDSWEAAKSSHTCQAPPENGSYFQIIDVVFHIGHVVCASVHTNTRRKHGCGVMQHSALIHAVRLVCLGSPSVSAHCMVQSPYRWPHLNSTLGRTVPEPLSSLVDPIGRPVWILDVPLELQHRNLTQAGTLCKI